MKFPEDSSEGAVGTKVLACQILADFSGRNYEEGDLYFGRVLKATFITS